METTTSSETQNREPVAGETGNVAAGEPYDKGNEEFSTSNKSDQPTTSTGNNEFSTANRNDEPSTSTGNNEFTTANKTNESTNPASSGNADLPGNTTDTSAIRSEHDTDKTGVTSLHNPTSATSSDKPSSSNAATDSGPNPSVGAAPSSGSNEESNIRERKDDTEGPSEGSSEHNRIQEAKKEAEDAQNVDVSGPGPKTLEEKARESGGDISGAGKSGGDEEEDGPQKESHGEGTGEKYVKSSGLKADGGDFDAANPGAAKEADRLLEEKGIHHTPGAGPVEPEAEDSSPAGKEKLSLKDKIKAKLHKN